MKQDNSFRYELVPNYGSVSTEDVRAQSAVEESGIFAPAIPCPNHGSKCTTRETTCNLISVITGSGMLSLPFAAASMGWSSLFCLCMLGCIFFYSFHLLAQSINVLRQRMIEKHSKESHSVHTIKPIRYAIDNIDYLTFSKLAFGEGGDRLVLIIFASEMLLALMSFFINIGININTINSSVSVTQGIYIATAFTVVMSFFELKLAAYSSALGLGMTLFTIFALFISGFSFEVGAVDDRKYQWFVPSGVPMAIGLIAFCFGGHGTFPKMYQSMVDRNKYMEVLKVTAFIVLVICAIIMFAGYSFFAQYTQAPVTLNIGRDLQLHDLPQGNMLRIMAALGVVSNLQVTCPLVTIPLVDVLLKSCHADISHRNQRLTAIVVVLVTMYLALSLDEHFASVCSLIGAFATFTNSIILPLIFYHNVHGDCSKERLALHAIIFVVSLLCAGAGIFSSMCTIFKWEACHYLFPAV